MDRSMPAADSPLWHYHVQFPAYKHSSSLFRDPAAHEPVASLSSSTSTNRNCRRVETVTVCLLVPLELRLSETPISLILNCLDSEPVAPLASPHISGPVQAAPFYAPILPGRSLEPGAAA